MKTDTSWQILVLSFALTTHSSQGSSACPESLTKNFPNSGSLILQCFSPSGSSMSSSTRPDDKTTLFRSATRSSTPTKSTNSAKIDMTVLPPTESTKSGKVEPTTSTITDTTVYGEKTNKQSSADDFPVPAIAGGVGAIVVIAVVVIVVVVFVKKRRNKKHPDNDGDYCNMDADPYKYQNTKSSGRHSGVSADQNQTVSQTIRSPSDDYASIDDEAGGTTRKPQVAIKPNLPSTSRHGDLLPEPDHVDVSNMYAKVNKNKKPAKSVNEAAMPITHVNELYAVVNKTKKTKPSLKAKPSGDVYAVVNKQKKSGRKSSESKGQTPESDVPGDVYTEVRKPKKSNIPSPGATGGDDDKTDSVATVEDRVLYSKVC
ncbi:uncharacterized protein LOC121390599 isoform X2 [Gigantopelta aegis]|uniref:uncharacterized protein LOC121390599 isoform X2 n=1 Tax=Gigantopelta aegis TaxID=1735272 RepID=UPI001B88E2E9|nr:uncharacterized protein LOC121390599 isoform X2 [Gigantopelta aegis]